MKAKNKTGIKGDRERGAEQTEERKGDRWIEYTEEINKKLNK